MIYEAEAREEANLILSVLQNIEDKEEAEEYVITELPEDYVLAKQIIKIIAGVDKRIQQLAGEL